MIELDIPGWDKMQIHHLVCDVNGTVAVDGELIEGVDIHLNRLRERVQIHMVTANIHGRQEEIDRRLGLKAAQIAQGNEAEAKAAYVRALGSDRVVAIGQGANDAGMLRQAALGICLLSPEGLSVEALIAADLIAQDIGSAFTMLENPLRLAASLRR